MFEILQKKRNLSLITLEALREFRRDGIDFEYYFECVGASARGMPQYNMYINQGQDQFLLVGAKVTRSGPKIRNLNLFPAVVTIHNEFGDGEDINLNFMQKVP